ncbi:MAG TPA: hypothetical protein VHB30_12845, partial [Solirubrobacteraceae bacterium]|nr:hypothetical protein [Solirubrobacteraceae bacterium]
TLATVAFTWSVDRAAGVAALLLSSASVTVGVLASLRAVRDARALHEALSLATLAALAVHGLAFALDPYLGAGLVGAAVPFASPWRPLAVAAGQVAGYGLAALGLSYYVRGRLGPARWRAAHRFAGAFWLLGVVHAIFAGSDAGRPWLLLVAAAPVIAAIVALAARWESRSATE